MSTCPRFDARPAIAPDLSTPPVALVRFPPDATEPVFVRFEGVEIEVAICTRETYAAKIGLLPADWSVQGVYVLAGPAGDATSDIRARPGTTQTRPLLERVDQHLNDAEWWRQVILIRRMSRQFDNAEAGYLETLLHEVVDDAALVEPAPGSNRSHYTGPASTDVRRDLETRVLSAIKVGLRLAGLRIETAEELERVRSLQPRRRADQVGA